MQPDGEGVMAVDLWLGLARADLRVARTADSSDPLLRGLCCFHCQQSVEKALKGVLVSRRIGFRKSHNLSYLVELLVTNSVAVPFEVKEAAIRLNEYIVDSRYPDELFDVTRDMLDEAIDHAKNVLDWAEGAVGA